MGKDLLKSKEDEDEEDKRGLSPAADFNEKGDRGAWLEGSGGLQSQGQGQGRATGGVLLPFSSFSSSSPPYFFLFFFFLDESWEKMEEACVPFPALGLTPFPALGLTFF